MDDIRFSITVPIYNIEKYLDKCIQSVLSQTFSNWELILVNDGSPDSSPAICLRYAEQDSRIKVVNKKNGGLVSARKAGAMNAAGEYIVCLDGDDWMDPKTLEAVDRALTEQGPADMVCFGYYYASEDGNIPGHEKNRFGYYSRSDIEKEIFPMLVHTESAGYFAPSAWAKAFRKELYIKAQMPVDERISIGEDGALTIPAVMNAQSLIILEDRLYYYRTNPASMTKNKKPFAWEAPVLIFRRINDSADEAGLDFSAQADRRLSHDLFNVAVSRFYSGKPYKEVKKEILQHLAEPDAAGAVRRSRFSGSIQAAFMDFAMKHRLVFLMYVYSRVK